MMCNDDSECAEEQADNTFHDLMEAAASSTGFWDNPEDDEDWNNV
jgi:hypothetical protein